MKYSNLIPKAIQPYFDVTQQLKDCENYIIEGALTCCNAHNFEVFVVGEIKHSMFSKMFLYPENDKTVFEVRCKNCGKVISVFNSSYDGYNQCENKPQNISALTRRIDCSKCQSESFSVAVKYEYSDIQELNELKINDIGNAFTWIWITLECNKCGTKYKNFVDCETT